MSDETETPYAVLWWGSHPDDNNDDCWVGEDYATLTEAHSDFSALPDFSHTDSHTIAFVELTGPGVYEIRPNPEYDAKRCEREDRADDRAWRQEIAMQAGMAFGCQGYNDAMGY